MTEQEGPWVEAIPPGPPRDVTFPDRTNITVQDCGGGILHTGRRSRFGTPRVVGQGTVTYPGGVPVLDNDVAGYGYELRVRRPWWAFWRPRWKVIGLPTFDRHPSAYTTMTSTSNDQPNGPIR